ncbi:hypothetical protein BH11PLA2_BH11PLA2_39070 [soil metagenome]
MKYENITLQVPPAVKSRMVAKAKECSLDVDTWLSEVMTYLSSDDYRNEREAFDAAMEHLRSRTPADAEAGLARMLSKAPPIRKVSPGKCIDDMLGRQKWPGNDTTQEVNDALEKVS